MARKYFFTFKTFQNHTCRVDINDATYSGTAIELTKSNLNSPGCPADDPVVIEEDNSDNLFDVVRTKTGYLNLIEFQEGSLDDLHPQRNNDLEVYVLMDAPSSMMPTDDSADDYIIFHGYIQAQSFDNTLYGYRNKKKIPIQSVMGVIEADDITIGYNKLRKMLWSSFGSYYKYVVMPEMTYNPSPGGTGTDVDIMEAEFSRNILYPYNDEYNHGVSGVDGIPSVYTPISKFDLIEGLCYGLGLMAHDVGNMLVFTSYNVGRYHKYKLSELGDDTEYSYDTITPEEINIGQFDFADDKSRVSSILPVKKITAEWDKQETSVTVDLSICKEAERNNSFMALEYMGQDIISSIWNNTTSAVANTIRMLGYRGESTEVLEITSNQRYLDLFSVDFEVPYSEINMLYFANNLHLDLYGPTRTGLMEVAVYSGGKYFNFDYNPEQGDDAWIDTPKYKELSPSGTAPTIDLPIEANGRTLRVLFRNASTTALYYQVTNIELQYVNNYVHFELSPFNIQNRISYTYNNGAYGEETMNKNFAFYTLGATFWLAPEAWPALMSIERRKLELHVRKKTAVTELQMLLGQFTFRDNSANRIFSTRHKIREDIYEITAVN